MHTSATLLFVIPGLFRFNLKRETAATAAAEVILVFAAATNLHIFEIRITEIVHSNWPTNIQTSNEP